MIFSFAKQEDPFTFSLNVALQSFVTSQTCFVTGSINDLEPDGIDPFTRYSVGTASVVSSGGYRDIFSIDMFLLQITPMYSKYQYFEVTFF